MHELLAAISFHDAWAYILHNADESSLPMIDSAIPPLPISERKLLDLKEKLKRGHTNTDIQSIVSNPDNQMWIQGPPPIFTNNEAPALARSLDALSCAVRSCCDQANKQFFNMANAIVEESKKVDAGGMTLPISSTGLAVMAREQELCNRNLVLSAATLLRQYETSTNSSTRGHQMAVHIMDAFLVNTGDESGGFSGEQIKSLLSACNILIDHPLLLYQPGPLYHMMTNAAVLLCHVLNGLYANFSATPPGGIEVELFQEVLDAFISVRNLVDCHRKKMPPRLRCHGIPRPNISLLKSEQPEAPLIDLGKTVMCSCRGCQGFVLVACSPCVTAEKAQAERLKQQPSLHQEVKDHDAGNFDSDNLYRDSDNLNRELVDLGIELDLDDDALLSVLSRIIAL